jgi:hypothetical protein
VHGRVGNSVLGNDRLKTALSVVMAQLHSRRIKRNRAFAPGDLCDVVGRHEEKLSVWIHEFPD